MQRFALILAFIFTAFSAHATTAANGALVMPQANNQVCNIYGTYTSKSASLSQVGGYEACSTDMISAKTKQSFVGFRLEPMVGPSITPVNKTFGTVNRCFYLLNKSNASYFVPASTLQELDMFLAHMPSGVSKIDCAQPENISVQDRCGGVMVSSPGQPYKDGFQALGFGRAGIDSQRLYIIDKSGKVLRTMVAVATNKGWAISFSGACPADQATAANNVAAPAGVATPAAFNRNGTATITDGALVRHISG